MGQLAVDLLLTNLPKVGSSWSNVDHPALLPIASPDAIDAKSDKFMTSCQGELIF